MTYRRTLTALTVFTALTASAAIAEAEVPQSRIAPPHEDRLKPLQNGTTPLDDEGMKAARLAWRKTPEGRSARRSRTAGIVLFAVSGFALPIGGLWMYSSSNPDNGMSGPVGEIGAGLLAIGGFSLLIGIPLFVNGVTAKPSAAVPAVQVGSRSASLTWSF
jgi:hypothetical protein